MERSEPHHGRGRWLALAVAGLLLACYGLSASKLYFGYEGQNIDQLEACLRGKLVKNESGAIEPYTPGGILDVAVYLPSALAKLALERHNALPGFRQIAYTFVMPAVTVLLCMVFYAMALRLWRDRRLAAFLTLTLGLATFIWPYAKIGMEPQITLWTLAAIWALIAWAEDAAPRHAVLFGIALGAIQLTKITGILHTAGLGAAAAWIVWRHKLAVRDGFKRDATLAIALTLLGTAILLVTNKMRYGGWLYQGRYNMEVEVNPYPLWEAIDAIAVSPGKSLFIYSPPLLVALWFWLAFLRRFPIMRPIFAVLLLIAIFHIRNRTWADETWGPRRIHFVVPILLLPLGEMFRDWRAIRPWVRRLAAAVIVIGILVQMLAVSFNYAARFFVLAHTRHFAVQYTVWQPRLSAISFNAHLLRSLIHRHRTGESLPFVWQEEHLAISAPPTLPAPEVYPVKNFDRLDLWYLQQRADWPDRPYWFVSPSSWLAVAFAAMGLVCVLMLFRNLCRRDAEPG